MSKIFPALERCDRVKCWLNFLIQFVFVQPKPLSFKYINPTSINPICMLTLQEGASGMDIKKGGAFNARPYKNPFKGPIFLHRKGWGIKITSEKIFEIGF